LVSTVTSSFWVPFGATEPLVGATDSQGTSLKAGTPLSTRKTLLGIWAMVHRSPFSSISRPPPWKPPACGCGSTDRTVQSSGFSS
jgi:hypothetical protein